MEPCFKCIARVLCINKNLNELINCPSLLNYIVNEYTGKKEYRGGETAVELEAFNKIFSLSISVLDNQQLLGFYWTEIKHPELSPQPVSSFKLYKKE